MLDNYKRCKICILGMPEGNEGEKQEIFKVMMTENLLKLNTVTNNRLRKLRE